jgi:GAF domain-containing protein
VCDVHIGADDRPTLQAVIEAVSSARELDHVLAGIVDIATEATGCYAALVYLRDGERLELRAASPVHAHLVGALGMGTGEGVTGWVARTGEPVFIRDDAIADPRHKYFPELEEERFQSMAAVPVRGRDGAVVGVIVLHTAAPHEFDEEVLAFLGHTATLLGGAVEHARLYAEAAARVRELTVLTRVSEALAAATEADAISATATSGARELLGATLSQLFRLEADGRNVRLMASDPPDAPAPRAQSGALLLELLAQPDAGLWPGCDGGAVLTAPLAASGHRLGVLCCVVPAPHDASADLLRAVATQTAVGMQRAELIARLTVRDRVKDLFDALAAGDVDQALLRAAPAGFSLTAPHVFLYGEGAGTDWQGVAATLQGRLRGCFLDPGGGALRGVVAVAGENAVAHVVTTCDEIARGEGIAFGVSAVGQSAAEGARGLREAADAARIAAALRPAGGALGFEGLGAYKYLVHLDLGQAPRDRHWRGVEALLEHDRRRGTALVATLERYLALRRSVVETARELFIHPNTLRQRLARIERVAGIDVGSEDLLALELAIKLVRLQEAQRAGGT